MSWVLIKRFWMAVLLMPALALGQAATQSGDLSVNSPAREDMVVPVVGPVVPALAVAPTTQPDGRATTTGETPVLPVPDLHAATRPAAVAGVPATQPEIYRSAIEKMPIRGSTGESDTGAGGGAATPASPVQAVKTGLSQSGISTAIQVGGALFIVIGLIFIARAMARKWVPGAGASNGKNVIEILARYPLAKAQSLVMVRIGSQIVVLNQTREASTSVLVISEQGEVANILGQIQGGKPTSIQAGFTKLLANAQMDLEREEMPEGDAIEARMQANQIMEEEQLDEQLDEMAAAKRQLMELRTQVRTIRDSLK